jgi:hypothetical protein
MAVIVPVQRLRSKFGEPDMNGHKVGALSDSNSFFRPDFGLIVKKKYAPQRAVRHIYKKGSGKRETDPSATNFLCISLLFRKKLLTQITLTQVKRKRADNQRFLSIFCSRSHGQGSPEDYPDG